MSRLAGSTLAAGLIAVLALGSSAAPAAAEENLDSQVVRVGLVKSLLRDTPEAMYPSVLHTFKALITSQSGLESRLNVSNSPEDLGRELVEGKSQVGVFHGFEFAWAQQTCPRLKPLVLAVNHGERLHACLVVGKDSGATRLADLRGKTLALPHFTREHCRLYLERECQKCGTPLAGFFGKVCTPSNVEEALDLVATGRVAATVVDESFLDWYHDQKAARFASLKKVEQSEAFPAAVVAYNPDTLEPAAAERLRQGLLNANKTARGQKILGFCQITRFQMPTDGYNQLLADIARSYPPAATDTKGR